MSDDVLEQILTHVKASPFYSTALDDEKAALRIHIYNQCANYFESYKIKLGMSLFPISATTQRISIGFFESKWISRSQAEINIENTLLPKNT